MDVLYIKENVLVLMNLEDLIKLYANSYGNYIIVNIYIVIYKNIFYCEHHFYNYIHKNKTLEIVILPFCL